MVRGSDMNPCSALKDAVHNIAANAVDFAEILNLNTPTKKLPDFKDNFLSHFRTSVPLSMSWPSLRNRILAIFEITSKKKMFGIYARRIVAMMTNLQAFGNWPKMQLPRGPVRSRVFPSLGTIPNHSIFISVNSTMPNPTSLRFFGMPPKPLFESLSWFGALHTAIFGPGQFRPTVRRNENALAS